MQGFRVKNTTRRVEIFQPEPVGLGLSWVVLDAYLCAWVNKKIPGTWLYFRKKFSLAFVPFLQLLLFPLQGFRD